MFQSNCKDFDKCSCKKLCKKFKKYDEFECKFLLKPEYTMDALKTIIESDFQEHFVG